MGQQGGSVGESGKAEVFVMMGVTGCGKTTIGKLLAERLDGVFADADDFHSEANKAKMAAGIPLTDEDRAPWLAALNRLLQGWDAGRQRGVLACSALKEGYRVTLAQGLEPEVLHFVWLDLPKAVLQQRLAQRQHEFMNPALLDSQLATLEVPSTALRVVNDRSPETVVEEILERYTQQGSIPAFSLRTP